MTYMCFEPSARVRPSISRSCMSVRSFLPCMQIPETCRVAKAAGRAPLRAPRRVVSRSDCVISAPCCIPSHGIARRDWMQNFALKLECRSYIGNENYQQALSTNRRRSGRTHSLIKACLPRRGSSRTERLDGGQALRIDSYSHHPS